MANLIYLRNPNIDLLITHLKQNRSQGTKGRLGFDLLNQALNQVEEIQKDKQILEQLPLCFRGVYSRFFAVSTNLPVSTVGQTLTSSPLARNTPNGL